MSYYYSQPMWTYLLNNQRTSLAIDNYWNSPYMHWSSIVSLNELAQLFWLWNDQMCSISSWSKNEDKMNNQMNLGKIFELDYTSLYSWNKTFDDQMPSDLNTLKRHRKNSLPNINRNLQRILMLSYNGKEVAFKHSTKSARGLFYGVSRRRSQYIGVLKNRGKWQVLINEGRIKKYIGTYPSEAEAAVVHDFYSIGINGLSAKTNFSYTHSQVMKMIEIYFSNNRIFDPSIFLQMN